jgi:hypothetical protein
MLESYLGWNSVTFKQQVVFQWNFLAVLATMFLILVAIKEITLPLGTAMRAKDLAERRESEQHWHERAWW